MGPMTEREKKSGRKKRPLAGALWKVEDFQAPSKPERRKTAERVH
jgi:hypothetical protein